MKKSGCRCGCKKDPNFRPRKTSTSKSEEKGQSRRTASAQRNEDSARKKRS